MHENILIRRCLKGDSKALETLNRWYAPFLWNALVRTAGEEAAREGMTELLGADLSLLKDRPADLPLADFLRRKGVEWALHKTDAFSPQELDRRLAEEHTHGPSLPIS